MESIRSVFCTLKEGENASFLSKTWPERKNHLPEIRLVGIRMHWLLQDRQNK
jgi:hypothetical protein